MPFKSMQIERPRRNPIIYCPRIDCHGWINDDGYCQLCSRSLPRQERMVYVDERCFRQTTGIMCQTQS